jgi:hypothetical protein
MLAAVIVIMGYTSMTLWVPFYADDVGAWRSNVAGCVVSAEGNVATVACP